MTGMIIFQQGFNALSGGNGGRADPFPDPHYVFNQDVCVQIIVAAGVAGAGPINRCPAGAGEGTAAEAVSGNFRMAGYSESVGSIRALEPSGRTE